MAKGGCPCQCGMGRRTRKRAVKKVKRAGKKAVLDMVKEYGPKIQVPPLGAPFKGKGRR